MTEASLLNKLINADPEKVDCMTPKQVKKKHDLKRKNFLIQGQLWAI